MLINARQEPGCLAGAALMAAAVYAQPMPQPLGSIGAGSVFVGRTVASSACHRSRRAAMRQKQLVAAIESLASAAAPLLMRMRLRRVWVCSGCGYTVWECHEQTQLESSASTTAGPSGCGATSAERSIGPLLRVVRRSPAAPRLARSTLLPPRC